MNLFVQRDCDPSQGISPFTVAAADQSLAAAVTEET